MSLTTVLERSRRDREDWRYTDLEKLLGLKDAKKPQKSSAAAVLPTLPGIVTDATQRHRIVFVNGVWRQDLMQLGDLPGDTFQGDAKNGYRLSFAARSCLVTAPIELVFVTDGGAAETGVRLTIEIGPSASLTLVEHHTGAGAGAHVIETGIHLGAQAKLVHEKFLCGQKNAAHLARTDVTVDEGAYYRNFALIQDTKLVRNEIAVTLGGKLAQCALNGTMLLRGQEHADTLTRITHAAPHGTSRQLYKSVVTDRARGVFQGKITVAEDAQKTDGRQLSRALLLSDQAEMDAKPELEIYADDVSCSHGSAVGALDNDALFYLRARGIGEADARALLLRGFIEDALEEVQAGEVRDYARMLVEGWLHEQD